jgi:hypothetical protein
MFKNVYFELWIIPTLAVTQNWPKKHWSLLDLGMFWSLLTFSWLNFFWNFVLNFYLGDILKWIHSPPNQGFFGCQIFATWWQKSERPANCQRLFEGIKGPQVVIFQGGGGGGVWLFVPQDVKFPHKIMPKNAYIYVNGWDRIRSSHHLWSVFF